MQRVKLFIPLIIFAALAVVFFLVERRVQTGDYSPTALPSALLDRPLPEFSLTTLKGEPIRKDQLLGDVFLLNVWATWCPTCHYEHPFLVDLAQRGVNIVGVDYKDGKQAAIKWLEDKGDPYTLTIFGPEGTLGLDLGVTGAPETYLVDAQGVVRFRYQGALDAKVWESEFAQLYNQYQSKGVVQ